MRMYICILQELEKVTRRVKALETGPRNFEHILMNAPIPGGVQRTLFQKARKRFEHEKAVLKGKCVSGFCCERGCGSVPL